MLLPSMPQLRRRSGSFARIRRFGSWTSGSKTIGHSSEMTKRSGDFAPNQIRAPRPSVESATKAVCRPPGDSRQRSSGSSMPEALQLQPDATGSCLGPVLSGQVRSAGCFCGCVSPVIALMAITAQSPISFACSDEYFASVIAASRSARASTGWRRSDGGSRFLARPGSAPCGRPSRSPR